MPRTSSPLHTSANAIVQQIQEWQSDCVAGHHKCGLQVELDVSGRTLPTRLLDVGCVPDQASIKLVQTSSLAASTSYITLSHRWGSRSGFKLTNERLAEYQDKILLRDLPPTFADTVHLVRKLGTRYLWIDMLCIIQDSDEDWRRESSNMCDVYANSELNIAAEASADSADGLYRQRNPLNYMPCKIVNSRKGYPRQEFCLTRVTSSLERDALLRSPLNKRAWVMQERLLAPRVVHFMPEQVIWECVSGYRSESFNPVRVFHDAVWKDLMTQDRPTYDYTDTPDSSFRRSWLRLVERYSNMNMTEASDKLVAISGLAKRMDQMSKGILGKYAAGLWNSCIAAQLCWYVSSSLYWHDKWHADHLERLGRQLTYRAPSWSWASVDGVINYGHSAMRAATHPGSWMRVLDVQTTTAGDGFGAVSAGLIRLQGQLQRIRGYDIRSNKSAERQLKYYDRDPKVGGHVFPGCVYWENVSASGLDPPVVAAKTFALLIGKDIVPDDHHDEIRIPSRLRSRSRRARDEAGLDERTKVKAIPSRKRRRTSQNPQHIDSGVAIKFEYPRPKDCRGALILTPTSDKAGQYRRVAWLDRDNDSSPLGKWTDLMLPPELYIDVVVDHLNRRQYVIEII